MDSCAPNLQYSKPRCSLVKPHALEAPRQVIGFNLLPKGETIKANYGCFDDNSEIIKRAGGEGRTSPKGASSPRSALQQLLLNQSPSATSSPPAANHNSTHTLLLKPPCPVQPPSSPHSANHNLTSSRLLITPPPASPLPAASQHATSGIFETVGQSQCASSPAREMKPSSGLLESLLQSEGASSAKQDSRASLLSSLGQSQWASSPPSSVNQSLQIRHESEVQERFNAVIRTRLVQNEIKGRLSGVIKEVSNEHCSCVGKSRKSSSWKEVANPEKGKKSSLFMFVVSSSPAAEHRDFHAETDLDFLNSCHLCRRLLGQAQDVFMYSGDKAFCSMECRYQQIVMDERNERRAPPVIRSGAPQIMYNQHTTTTTTTTTTTATVTTSATHHPIMISKPKYFITDTAAAA